MGVVGVVVGGRWRVAVGVVGVDVGDGVGDGIGENGVGADVGDGVGDVGNVVIFVGLGSVNRSVKGLMTRARDSVCVGVAEGVGRVVGDGIDEAAST